MEGLKEKGVFISSLLIFLSWLAIGLYLMVFGVSAAMDINGVLTAYESMNVLTGLLVFGIGLFGLYCLILRDRERTKVLIICLCILILVVFSIDITFLGSKEDIIGLHKALRNYNDTRYPAWHEYLDGIQLALKCCGRRGPADFDEPVMSRTPAHCNGTAGAVESCHAGGDCSKELYMKAN